MTASDLLLLLLIVTLSVVFIVGATTCINFLARLGSKEKGPTPPGPARVKRRLRVTRWLSSLIWDEPAPVKKRRAPAKPRQPRGATE